MSKKLSPLEAYKKVSDYCREWLTFDKELDIIETALKRLESVDRVGEMFCCDVDKKLKALEIIKEKGVNIYLLNETDNVEEYNELIKSHYGMKQLTQEEYDLLKEVLL